MIYLPVHAGAQRGSRSDPSCRQLFISPVRTYNIGRRRADRKNVLHPSVVVSVGICYPWLKSSPIRRHPSLHSRRVSPYRAFAVLRGMDSPPPGTSTISFTIARHGFTPAGQVHCILHHRAAWIHPAGYVHHIIHHREARIHPRRASPLHPSPSRSKDSLPPGKSTTSFTITRHGCVHLVGHTQRRAKIAMSWYSVHVSRLTVTDIWLFDQLTWVDVQL